jgi:AhpD family alkylhydroperoxidase
VKSRIEYAQVVPDAIEALRALEKYVRTCGIEPKALELIKIRASQINGCAYCLDMHTKGSRTWRNRAADLCAQRLARNPVFH